MLQCLHLEVHMAYPNRALILALEATHAKLKTSPLYAWGHLGACNCGHLAQVVTRKSAAEIHRLAVRRAGDWGEVAIDYCPQSGLPVDHVLSEMFDLGLSASDIEHFEDLSDPEVLAELVAPGVYLSRNDKDHVLMYIEGWITVLKRALNQKESALQTETFRKAS
ncbi:MAG: hypothetical protein CMH56_06735 [Myxococcales bacterium]|nr:hypothetical protein [Myxococcales bacterium]